MRFLPVSSVEVESSGAVTTLWLNRPAVHNAYDDELLSALAAGLHDAEADPDNRVVVIRGRGKSFCAGADMRWLSAHGSWSELGERVSGIFNAIARSPRVTIAVVHGWAVAGGLELMLACDLALAAEDARVGDFHIQNGLFGGAGVTYRLLKLVGPRRARELMLSGDVLSGREAAAFGLVNGWAPGSELDERVARFAERFANRNPEIVALTKQALNRSADADFETATLVEREISEAVGATRAARSGVSRYLSRHDG
jgi:enoyl-CoA hydratase